MRINVSFDQPTNTLAAGFVSDVNAVAAYFASQFTDNVTFTLHVGFGEIDGDPVDPTLVGQGETRVASYGFYSYAQIRAALANDARTADDVSAVGSHVEPDTSGDTHRAHVHEANGIVRSDLQEGRRRRSANPNAITGYRHYRTAGLRRLPFRAADSWSVTSVLYSLVIVLT